MPLTPYTGTFGHAELSHLLRRTLFGCTPGDLAHFNGMTLDQTIDELLTFTNDTTPPLKTYSVNLDPNAIDASVAFGSTWVNTPRDPSEDPQLTSDRLQSFYAWWMGLMVGQQRNLREKLTLFWQQNLATQASVVFNSEAGYSLNQTQRTNCMGNFKELVRQVSIEPAMLYYLNGYLNIAAAPDENYGRELMELFTLGEGSGYTESDVEAAARVLTGWTVQEENGGVPILPQTAFIPANHTTTDKQFSAFFNNTVITGQSGPDAGTNELGALLDMIVGNDACSLFICRKIYHFFVHGLIDAQTETDVIQPLAQIFRDNSAAPDQLRTVLRALFTSDHFFSTQVRACMVKSPADLVVGELRLFNMPFPDASLYEAQYLCWLDVYWLIDYAGQTIGEPPNVAGWTAYYLYPAYDELWLDTASFPARNNSVLGISYSGFTTPAATVLPDDANLVIKADLVAWTQLLSNPSDPNVLISDAADLLFAVPVSQSVKDQLKTNYLLFGQTNDAYWTDAYDTYVADPNTQDMAAQLVPNILLWLITDMQKAAEHHLF